MNIIETKVFKIDNIPAILWGKESDKIYIFVHGKMSNKEDAKGFAEKATERGYQVLSFDLPEHGDRKNEDYQCNVWNGVYDLTVIRKYVQQQWSDISLFATSLGAYFSLLAYNKIPIKKCMFLSPILDMERLIQNMMKWFAVSEQILKEKREIPTPMGETLSWDYYSYVKAQPIVKWDNPTSIIYGSEDNLTERVVIDDFVERFECELTVLQGGEHYFHTQEQMDFLFKWLDKNL